jgi:pyruvate/2-oxoglutarate dehydrogenase complex dihydrolipoamide acyltransferase (E2) component
MSSHYVKHKLSIHQKMVGDAVRIGKEIPYIHTLVELDATNARKFLREYRKSSGNNVSFSTYIMLCCAKAVQQDVSIQRMKTFGSNVLEFKEVDMFYPTEINDKTAELNSTLIRNVGQFSLTQLHNSLQKKNLNVSGKHKIFMRLPWMIRKIFYASWFAFPSIRKQYFGTVYFSSILNFSGDRRAWGVPIPMHPFGIFIGTMCKRLIESKDGIEKRDMVQITLSVDHRVSNGGDMGRFVHRLKHILEYEDLTHINVDKEAK